MSQCKPFTQAALTIFANDVPRTQVAEWALDMGRGVKDIQLLKSTALI